MVSMASQPERKNPPTSVVNSVLEMPLHQLIGWLLVCGCSFLNLVNVLVDKEEVGLDFQVLAKLGLIGIGGLYGFHGVLTRRRVWKMLQTFPIAWILIILVFYLIAIPFSISPKISLASTGSLVAMLMMMLTALDHLGVRKTVSAIFIGMALFVIGSWLVYFAIPEIGILEEDISGGRKFLRMSGLAHPNTLGQYSGLTFVVAVFLFFSFRQRNLFIAIVGLLALGALFNSFSRTSLMASGIAIVVGYRHLYLRRELLGGFVLAFLLFVTAVLMVGTQVDLGDALGSRLELLSKSDDAEELTTATGRSEIWGHAIFLLGKQPITGYGAATQKFFFEDYSLYTHNMFLNIAFSGGVFAGIAGLLMILGRLSSLFKNRHPLADALLVFIIVNGLFENMIFSILCGLPTMLWVLALAWPLMTDDPTVKMLNRTPEPKYPTSRRGYIRLETS